MLQQLNQSLDHSLTDYITHLADNALVLGQRNAAWTGHGPVLEQDIAISNIALDLIGQARHLYQYAARLLTSLTEETVTEDSLAYWRTAQSFKNCLMAELERGDWALTVLRQFFFSNYQHCLYGQLQYSRDSILAAIAEKSLKEVRYHLRWSSEWVIRLGDGTAESHRRIHLALMQLWPYTAELMEPAPYEIILQQQRIAADLPACRPEWTDRTRQILEKATLSWPSSPDMQYGGKHGAHTSCLDDMLTEMQYLQRTYPGNEW